MSVDECQNLLSLPGRDILSEYKNIENVNTFESEVPQELQSGVMCKGIVFTRVRMQKRIFQTIKSINF